MSAGALDDESRWVRLDQAELRSMFPRPWASGSIDERCAAGLLGSEPHEPDTRTHSAIAVGWTYPSLCAHVIEKDPADGARIAGALVPDAWHLCLHDADESTSQPVIGFCSFTPTVSCNSGAIVGLDLRIDAVWVDPGLRGHGYGRHLMANLASYLDQHGPSVPDGRRRREGPGVVVKVAMPTPERRAERLVDHLRRFFKPSRCPRWKPTKVIVEPF